MRTTLSIASVLAIVLASFVAAPPAKADADVSFGFFYSDLSPHGSWLVSAQYGRVWQPAVYRSGWNPYYDGHWECADLGWVWVSDYSWGDVPYHYGTWVLDPRWGWVWVPGYTWAPSWVVFRTGPDYIGWAPVPPRFTVGASFTFGSDPDLFLFVRAGDFLSPRIRTRVVPNRYYRTAIRRTTFVNRIRVENDIVVNRGPDLRFVERATRRDVRPQPIERIHRALPRGHTSRHDLRADRGGHRLRAADPVPRGTPDPGHARGRRDHERHESPAMRPDHGPDRREPRANRAEPNRPRHEPRMQRQERGTRGQRDSRVERGDRNRSQNDSRMDRQERGSRDRGNAKADRAERGKKGDRGKGKDDKKKDEGKGKGKGRR